MSLCALLFSGDGHCGLIAFAASIVVGSLAAKCGKNKGCREINAKSKKIAPVQQDEFDVIICGAGPSGATAAYFLGKQGLKVALVDKKTFPRNKFCGDAWCKPALDILEEMGVLKKMEADGITHPVTRGGFISPFGYECINRDGNAYGSTNGCKTYAIKRRIADEYIVREAVSANKTVTLMEETEITDASLEDSTSAPGTWKVSVKSASRTELKGRMLLVCDGSTSYLAQKLGILQKGCQSEATCSHAYVKGGTHTWSDADGVMIFNKAVLPGYSALFKHYNGDMYYGTYILPGGKATSRAIVPFENETLTAHPYVKNAFGDKWSYEEKRVVAPIRCGGIPKSYAKQVLVVGDAAGHVDPLTGEGIHTAMIAGKIAAQTVGEMYKKHNFDECTGRAYELRCYDAFGYEFWSSSAAARVIYALPIALDAVAVVGTRRGQAFLDFFGEAMTGVRPKSDFAQPGLLLDITMELVRQVWLQYVWGVKPLVPQDIGVQMVDEQAKKKQLNPVTLSVA